MSDYELTPEQLKVCKSLKRLLTKARKMNICILGKSDCLEAFSKKALTDDNVYCALHEHWNYGEYIPYFDLGGITDSGADDTEYFHKDVEWMEEDE